MATNGWQSPLADNEEPDWFSQDEQSKCDHAFTDEYHDTTCYRCGLEVNV